MHLRLQQNDHRQKRGHDGFSSSSPLPRCPRTPSALIRLAPCLSAAVVALLPVGRAHATKCNRVMAEYLDLSPVEIRRGRVLVDDDAIGLGDIRVVTSSQASDTGVEVSEVPWNLAAGWELEEPLPPTGAAKARIEEYEGRRARRSLRCGRLAYQPVQPGVYVPGQAPDDEGFPSVFVDPVLTIAADRETVTLEFEYLQADWVARYQVEGARYLSSGCQCSSDTGTGTGATLLGLLALLGVARRPRAHGRG